VSVAPNKTTHMNHADRLAEIEQRVENLSPYAAGSYGPTPHVSLPAENVRWLVRHARRQHQALAAIVAEFDDTADGYLSRDRATAMGARVLRLEKQIRDALAELDQGDQ